MEFRGSLHHWPYYRRPYTGK